MGKGSNTTTTETKLDPDLKNAALTNLDLANEVGALGYMPYQGNTVAAFSPQQIAGMQSTDQAAAAFGMPSAINWQGAQGSGQMTAPTGMSYNEMYSALTGMAPPTQDASGGYGYSAMPLYNQAISKIPAAQRAALESYFMNPTTGAAPTNASVPSPRTQYTKDANGNIIVDPKSERRKNASPSKKTTFDRNEVRNIIKSKSSR